MLQAQLAIQRLLNDSFSASRLKNPSYSLRAFAKRLGCSSSAISEILNGRRNISGKLAARYLGRLGVDPKKSQEILSLFPEKKGRNSRGTGVTARAFKVGAEEMRNALQLQADTYAMIADWYHYGILNLVMTEGFKSDPLWIAHRLGLSVQEVKQALRRLLDLKFLRVTTNGEYKRCPESLMTSDDVPSFALRKAHGQHLHLAGRSLEEDPIDKRYFRFFTVALNLEHMEKLKEMIRDFTEKFCILAEQGKKT